MTRSSPLSTPSPLRPTRSGQNNPLAHALVEQNIEAQAAAFALDIDAEPSPAYGPLRDSYRAAAH